MSTKDYPNPYRVVSTGKNGKEALDPYAHHQPDIVLMDIRMPIMDGITAGKQLMADYPKAKLIYLTTFLEDDYIVEALKLGAKSYLMKTVFESLLPAIEAVFSEGTIRNYLSILLEKLELRDRTQLASYFFKHFT